MSYPNSLFPANGRRSFLKKSLLSAAVVASSDLFFLENIQAGTRELHNRNDEPWYRKISRWGQVNITEKDPVDYDVTWWRNYWKRTQTQGVVISAGGIVAYYPTAIPLHRRAEYLGNRDLFGELCAAAQEDGLGVFARMDSNRAHEDFYLAHPDWFALDADSKPYKAGDLFITCINGPYYEDHIPAIFEEIAKQYHPSGFTDNSWAGLGRESICYCENCQKSFKDKTGNGLPVKKNWDDRIYKEWIQWSYSRRLEIWDLNNKVTKAAGGEHCIWSGMNSGSISGQSASFRDFKKICERAEIIMLDHQSRSEATGFQQNGETGKLVHQMLGWDKLIPESMALYQAGRPTFRVSSKPEPEARMWILNGIAGGIQPWWHHVAAYHEDRRMYKTIEPIYKWHEANIKYLLNRQPIANVGVIWSQLNTDFYGRDDTTDKVDLPWRGITQALVRARIPFIPVHIDDIGKEDHSFSLLILPNIGVMSTQQVKQINAFVQKGGNLLATGESSLFNEWGEPLADYALSDVFGAHLKKLDKADTEADEKLAWGESYHTYLRLAPELRAEVDGPTNGKEPPINGKKRHPALSGFEETDILPYGGLLHAVEIDSHTEIIATYVPQFPVYPPETAWMRVPKTDIPGVLTNTKPWGSRVVFLPADIDRQFGKYNLPDHANLLSNLVQWALKEDIPLKVKGKGLIDCYVYQQAGTLILQVINLTNTAAWRQPAYELISVGPLQISVKLPSGISPKNIQFKVSNVTAQMQRNNDWVHFEIPSLLDHELIVLT